MARNQQPQATGVAIAPVRSERQPYLRAEPRTARRRHPHFGAEQEVRSKLGCVGASVESLLLERTRGDEPLDTCAVSLL